MLEKLSTEDRQDAANMLADYWKKRGMKQYDEEWAEGYLCEGHSKEMESDEFFAYIQRGEIVGLVSLIVDVSGVAEIRDMLIRPAYRHKGYGKKMLTELVKIAKKRKIRKLYALALDDSLKIYKGAKFKKEGLLKSHFAPGEDLTMMSRQLD